MTLRQVSEMPIHRGRRSESGRATVSGATRRAVAGDTPAQGIESLWLDVLQRIAGRAAHELKGALNGASVNLEVVRSRADASEMVAGEAISRYATAAANQLDAVITMSDALLAVARAPREAAAGASTGDDFGQMVRRLVALVAPALRIDEHTLAVVEPFDGVDTSTGPTLLVRALVGAALLDATERWAHTLCRADAEHNRLVIECEGVAASAASFGRDILDAAADAGIQVQVDGSAISMTFRPNTGRTTGMAS